VAIAEALAAATAEDLSAVSECRGQIEADSTEDGKKFHQFEALPLKIIRKLFTAASFVSIKRMYINTADYIYFVL
jgi:hypothetical protein